MSSTSAPVRPAHRPPRARSRRVLRAGPSFHAGRRDPGQGSEGDYSVWRPGLRVRARRATIDTKVFESGVPVLGICYGFQVMAYELGGKVDKAALGEYGKTSATIDDAAGILADSPAEQTTWMSHGVAVGTGPGRLRSAGPHRRRARGRHGGRIPQALWCAVAPGSQALPAWPEAYRKTSCTVAPRCPTTGMPPPIIEDQVKKIREQVATPR